MSKKSLNEMESARMLSSAGVNMVKSVVLTDGAETTLSKVAEELSFPVVMKILSDDILHKTDVGCVKLNISSVKEMKAAYDEIIANAGKNAPTAYIQGVTVQQMLPKGFEVLVGVSTDPQFGHVIMVGLGGIYVELLKAVSMRVLPITRDDAEQMIDETPVGKACNGLRGEKYDRQELVNVLLSISNLCEQHPEIQEIDINPFILYSDDRSATAVDAMIILNQ